MASLDRPKGRARRKPGSTGRGNYLHVEVRPRGEFVEFRTQDVGQPRHVQRVAGKRATGSWATVAWLISKEDAQVQGGRITTTSAEVRDVLNQLSSTPLHVQGDRFRAR